MEGGRAQGPTKASSGASARRERQIQPPTPLRDGNRPEQQEAQAAGSSGAGGGGGGGPDGPSVGASISDKKNPLRSLNILYSNVQSICNKIDELKCNVDDLDPDLIILTETWCHEDILQPFLDIPGYIVDPELRCDRKDTANGIGGGIIIYVRKGLTVLSVDKKSDFNQYCSFKIQSDSDILEFCVVYRSPNSSAANTNKLCELVKSLPKNCILVGDINLPGIDWKNHTSNNKGSDFFNSVNDSFLFQMIEFPTHVKGNILDLLITDCPERIISIEDKGRLGKSDHVMILIEAIFDYDCEPSIEQIPDWNKADISAIINDLNEVNWKEELSDRNTEEAWELFNDRVKDTMEKNVPKKPRRLKNNPIWMTKRLKKMLKKKEKAWNDYKKNSNPEKFAAYKKLEKSVQKGVKNSKKRFEKKLAYNQKNDKSFNSYLKSRMKVKTTVGPLKNDKKEPVVDSQSMAEMLNTYFISVFTKEGGTDIPVPDSLPAASELNSVTFTSSEVSKKIEKMKIGSPGPDGITVNFLKATQQVISEPLALIFTKSMNEGSVPLSWREANVTPIFKKGSKTETCNYRPVSLTSVVCKLMETIIRDQLIQHLEINALINPTQHGFMKHKSCTTNLLEFFEV